MLNEETKRKLLEMRLSSMAKEFDTTVGGSKVCPAFFRRTLWDVGGCGASYKALPGNTMLTRNAFVEQDPLVNKY